MALKKFILKEVEELLLLAHFLLPRRAQRWHGGTRRNSLSLNKI